MIIKYPTAEHQKAAEKIVEIFSKDKRVGAILLTNSCARGKATKDSCLDIEIIVKNIADKENIKKEFEKLDKKVKEFVEIKKAGKYSHIDFHVSDGIFKSKKRGWETGPDDFELEIGNLLVYSRALFGEKYFERIKKKYLPYYNEKLRKEKLKEALMYMNNNLGHIEVYVKKGLYFAAFSRLYNATKEFLQALFISKKVYPISYNKWIKEQLVEILNLPELYKDFVSLYEIKNLESDELSEKAEKLKELAKKYIK